MKAKSFISHTDDGGTRVGMLIKDQLIRTDLKMQSFLSQNSIEHGEHIPQKILEFLIETDVLFVILEPLVVSSRWVKWEYEFCKNRGIRIIPVVFRGFADKFKNQIRWIDGNERYMIYDHHEEFRTEVWRCIDDSKETLERRASERSQITLEASTNKTSYFEQDTVKISGQVTNSLTGSAYLYIPSMRDDQPPIKTNNIDTPVIPNDAGKFEFEFKLPFLKIRTQSIQKWFIEIKFDKKSKLIPISINVQDGNDGDSSSSEDSSDNSDTLEASFHDARSQKIKEQIQSISKGTVQSIPRTIKGRTIDKADKISKIVNMLDDGDRVVVTGDKGSGKSVLMCQLCERLKEQHPVLFLRCDDYLGIESFEQLNNNIIPGFNFIHLIQEIATESDKLIIIFDSLDAISRNEKSMNIFKQLLKNIWGTNKAQTVSSVRSYDYEYSPSINTTDWGKRYKLELLNTKELDAVLAELGEPRISDKLKNILYNPLHLKLLSLILEKSPDADFTTIRNEIELYEKHWDEYVEKLELPSVVHSTLYRIAQSMSSSQRISVSYDEFADAQAIQDILSRGIILRDPSSNLISFFHHAYLDYVISRFILTRHDEFVDYLQEDEYNVFLRPTVVFALSVLNKRDPKSAVKVIEKILDSELKYFWKISALTALAKIEENNDQDFTSLGNFLTKNTALQRHFLIEITKHKNVFWFDLWKESFFVEWSSIDNGNSWFVVVYLKLMADSSHNHQHIFKLLRLLATTSNLGPAKRESVKLSSELTVEGKADWLLELSSNRNTYIRNGVVEALSKLIETDPEIVPDVFCNLFTYVETSDERTQLATHGTFGMTSTRRQDNYMIILGSGELFPELLEKNPAQMIISAIRIFEVFRKEELDKYDGDVIEDHGYIWFEDSSFSDSRDEDKLLNCIREYLKNNCSDEQIAELIPIFKSTRLATFHSILLESLSQREKLFVNEIFQLLSNPKVYEISTLRKSVRTAIRKIHPLLTQAQIKRLLDLVMNTKLTDRELYEGNKKDLNKAEFLSEFPENVLQMQHHEILDSFSRSSLEYKPLFQYNTGIRKAPEDIADTEPSPEDIITSNIDKQLERRQKIDLLDTISEYLDKKTVELDKTKFSSIKEFLIRNKDDPDPQDNTEDEKDSSLIAINSTIRGLVARCLVRLLYHSKDAMLVPMIKKLADDLTNEVRGEICGALNYLFYYDYDLTYSIAQQYSKDPDTRTQFFLRDVLALIAPKNPKHATLIIINILNTLPTDYQKIHGIEGILIYLAFHKKENSAIDLLNKIVDEELFSSEIRRSIPFLLKEGYLFKDEFQDKSLDLLYRMLCDSDSKVRYKATFFTLCSRERDEYPDYIKYVNKIERHLDRIASEVDRQSWDPRLIEVLVRFLEKFWDILPEKTIDYLEKITGEKIERYSAYQAVLAEESVKILTGLFQHPLLYEKNRKRCLNILDKYAMAGWEEALQLLSAMERPD